MKWSPTVAGEIIIARVDEESEPGTYSVYIPIQEEDYFLVVVVNSDDVGELDISGIYVEAGVRVYLRIWSATLSNKEITTQLGMIPTETHAIGDPICSMAPERTYRENVWHFEPQKDIPGSVEEKLGKVLAGMSSATVKIPTLKPDCTLVVHVVFKGWGGDPQFGGFHLDGDMVQRLAALGAELDFDLYAFGPNMLEEEDRG